MMVQISQHVKVINLHGFSDTVLHNNNSALSRLTELLTNVGLLFGPPCTLDTNV